MLVEPSLRSWNYQNQYWSRRVGKYCRPSLLALTAAPSALVDGSMGVCEFSSLQPALTPQHGSTLRDLLVLNPTKKNENEIELELDIAFVG